MYTIFALLKSSIIIKLTNKNFSVFYDKRNYSSVSKYKYFYDFSQVATKFTKTSDII